MIEVKFYSKKLKRDEFLYSKANKQHYIHCLSDNLERAGCVLYRANDDADVLIFRTANATSSRHVYGVLIEDDTDLLFLLLHHAEMDAHRVFLKSEPNTSSQQNKIWFIEQSYSSPMQFLVVK